MKQVPLLICSIDRELFAGEVSWISAPSADGRIQVFAGHQPLISQLVAGDLRLKAGEEKEQTLPIAGGVLEITPHRLVALVNF